MAFAAEQRVVHNIGNVVNWLTRTDLNGRRMRLVDLDGQVRARCAPPTCTGVLQHTALKDG
jgi:hypothetical protein